MKKKIFSLGLIILTGIEILLFLLRDIFQLIILYNVLFFVFLIIIFLIFMTLSTIYRLFVLKRFKPLALFVFLLLVESLLFANQFFYPYRNIDHFDLMICYFIFSTFTICTFKFYIDEKINMKAFMYIPLIIISLFFYSFQLFLNESRPIDGDFGAGCFGIPSSTNKLPCVPESEIYSHPSFFDFNKTMKYISFHHNYDYYFLSISGLFQTVYGYAFLLLFIMSGFFIHPRRIGVLLSLVLYLILALVFTFI